MHYVKSDKIVSESKEIPDGEIFTVYTSDQKWCFAMKMKGEFTLSKPLPSDAGKQEVAKAWRQIKYAKDNGWSGTQDIGMDELGQRGRLFRCIYCNAETVEVDGPCSCRGKPKPKGMEDFLLPGDW